MKKILILSNEHSYTYNFRKEIIKSLIKQNYEVYVSCAYGEKVELLKEIGCKFVDIKFQKRGKNPFKDYILYRNYKKMIKKIRPDVILGYTIKPNIYGGLAANKFKIPCIFNITGLGTAVENNGILQKFLVFLYRRAIKKRDFLFFQNEENMDFFENKKIFAGAKRLLPGSGVNLDEYNILEYPTSKDIEFVYISRIMKEKGIEEYLSAAINIKKNYPNITFHICGRCDKKYLKSISNLHKENIIKYHGLVTNVKEILKHTHCTIHPTYYPEGMSNVLLESAASGRPIITTNRSGCKEIVDDGINGFIVNQKDSEDLIEKIEKFIKLDHEKKCQMGIDGRKKMKRDFDRKIVVDIYMDTIKEI